MRGVPGYPPFVPWAVPAAEPAAPMAAGLIAGGALMAAGLAMQQAHQHTQARFGWPAQLVNAVAAGAVAAAVIGGIGRMLKEPPRRKIGPKDWSPRTGECLCRKGKPCSM